jgi:hypothetical protein
MEYPWGVVKNLFWAVLAISMGAIYASLAFAGPDFVLRTLSSRPDMVSGEDALVELNGPIPSAGAVTLDGRNVTALFHATADGKGQVALVDRLRLGKNSIELRINGGVKTRLEIVDHPLEGPLLAGPHQQPFICQTEVNGLGSAHDSNCRAKTLVTYFYKSTDPSPEQISKVEGTGTRANVNLQFIPAGFKPYDLTGPMPEDLAQTVTSDGRTVKYIIRREIGTINRAVYEIEFLHQPGSPLSTPWSGPVAGWNGRLVYNFGEGCSAGYRQGTLGAGELTKQALLAVGYARVTSTLNGFGNNCNDRVSAETLSMVKEYFIKHFGSPVHTIGEGASGGAVQLYLIAQNYPGLLDGILPTNSFPDIVTIAESGGDCALLARALNKSEVNWTEAQKTSVSGFATWQTCRNWSIDSVPFADPRKCSDTLPKPLVFDRISNPAGARCDVYDNEISVFGRNPRTGVAYRPMDNVGVQYGLIAFNRGVIDAEQFIELNRRIGGYDVDGNIVSARTEAEPEAIRLAYDRGLVLTGGGGLSDVPIIDSNLWYSDDLADVHDHFRSLVSRARLMAANGRADNQVILVYPPPNIFPFYSPSFVGDYFQKIGERGRDLVIKMDQWLDRIAADGTASALSRSIARNKPADLVDSCIATDGERIVESVRYEGTGRCSQIYPPHGDPRLAAGAPLTDDVLKCSLKPVSASDYVRPLSADQLERLRTIFPSGVCDYRQSGVEQKRSLSTWQRF